MFSNVCFVCLMQIDIHLEYAKKLSDSEKKMGHFVWFEFVKFNFIGRSLEVFEYLANHLFND